MDPAYIIFEDIFHLALDIAFLWINCLMLMFVIKTKQQQHMKWVVLSMASNAIALFYRVVVVGHHFVGSQWTPQHYMAVDTLIDLENVANLVSTVLLWKVLKSSGFSMPAMVHPGSEGSGPSAWPPAPKS